MRASRGWYWFLMVAWNLGCTNSPQVEYFPHHAYCFAQFFDASFRWDFRGWSRPLQWLNPQGHFLNAQPHSTSLKANSLNNILQNSIQHKKEAVSKVSWKEGQPNHQCEPQAQPTQGKDQGTAPIGKRKNHHKQKPCDAEAVVFGNIKQNKGFMLKDLEKAE